MISFSIVAYATEPPPLPKPLPPLRHFPPPPPIPRPKPLPPQRPVTIDDLRHSSLSTTVKQWWIGILNATDATSVTTASPVEPVSLHEPLELTNQNRCPTPPNESLSVDQEPKSQTRDPSMGRLGKGVFTSAYAPTRQSQDARFEQETRSQRTHASTSVARNTSRPI